MGAGGLWNAEVQDPGTFDGLILFEPVYGEDDPVVTDQVTSFLVGVTLKRGLRERKRSNALKPSKTSSPGTASRWRRICKGSDHEIQQPKCTVRFHRAERSNMFFTPHFEHTVKLRSDIYSIGEPMKNCTHLMVPEDPESTANRIVKDLAKIAPFRKNTPK
ncbi:hypothetical protein GN244_ATG00998 [Phytophthora infestans]|uniref:Uncharacterized protein n=1 Tax=Phytophthora infestans TaxID=4787 RepID=A0A833WN11_PHYIN|nr:hypothetical protein GN244_ATG00998 [Phytophthora infestans]KAF4130150.1 hypothetical protein GN958_ATG20565 [Phytophthora infestans]